MKIKIEIEVSNVDEWSVDWKNNKEKELKQLNYDIKMALYEKVGVDLDNTTVKSEFVYI